jgi:hypothetical protein
VAVDTQNLLAWHRCVAAIERLQARAAAELGHGESPRTRLLRLVALLDVCEALTLDRLYLGAGLLVELRADPVTVSGFVEARCDELKAVRDQVARVLALLEDATDA